MMFCHRVKTSISYEEIVHWEFFYFSNRIENLWEFFFMERHDLLKVAFRDMVLS